MRSQATSVGDAAFLVQKKKIKYKSLNPSKRWKTAYKLVKNLHFCFWRRGRHKRWESVNVEVLTKTSWLKDWTALSWTVGSWTVGVSRQKKTSFVSCAQMHLPTETLSNNAWMWKRCALLVVHMHRAHKEYMSGSVSVMTTRFCQFSPAFWLGKTMLFECPDCHHVRERLHSCMGFAVALWENFRMANENAYVVV